MKKMFAMLLCLAILALGTGAALADGTTLSVTGNGTVLVESDLAIVTVGVQETSKDVLEAQSTVNEKIAAIKQALLDAGVEESSINTDSINIYANYDYSDNTEVIVGYTARNSLSVRTTTWTTSARSSTPPLPPAPIRWTMCSSPCRMTRRPANRR